MVILLFQDVFPTVLVTLLTMITALNQLVLLKTIHLFMVIFSLKLLLMDSVLLLLLVVHVTENVIMMLIVLVT